MQSDSKLQKLELYLAATVAAVIVLGLAIAVSTPFSAENYGVSDVSIAAPSASASKSAAGSRESVPDVLEPSLRSLDGVAQHG